MSKDLVGPQTPLSETWFFVSAGLVEGAYSRVSSRRGIYSGCHCKRMTLATEWRPDRKGEGRAKNPVPGSCRNPGGEMMVV